MEQKTEREWKSIVCPDWKQKAVVMCEWGIHSEEGRDLRKTLKQIDCHNPRLTEFGGRNCSWACEKAIVKEETTRSGMEWLLVCAILVGGILWIVLYDTHLRPHLHSYGLFLFFGLPLLVGLMSYYCWKTVRHVLRPKVDQCTPL
jgi:hypothetical protein